MQTTLLSAGIAIILALVAALVGPLFVDWGRYRADFESEVAHLTGLEVRVTGPIDVRLLPTPTLNLQDIELGRSGDPAKTRARALRIEFALGDLMRGTWRASDMILQGPELTLGLDSSGRLAWSAPTIGLAPDAVAIEHLEVTDGRAIFADAASGSHLSVDQLEFSGQVRSLLGPVKGEGSFAIEGRRYPFQLSVSRPADDGGVKVRLNLATTEQPRNVDVDGSIWVERGKPRFEGTLQVTRPVGRSPDGIVESWRVSSRLRADGAAAIFEQVDFQYGPEERAVRLKGDAKLSFGAAPQLVATLSAPQIDLDRMLATPETGERRPLVALERLAQFFVKAPPPFVPMRFGISVETVTLGGAMLQRVGGDIASDRDGWNIENFALRAPGLSQVAFSGLLSPGAGGAVFKGGTRIESADPRALIGWLGDRSDQPSGAAGPLHLGSDLSITSDKIALDRLQLELDHMKIDGRLDYAWPSGDRPARLDAALHAPDIDFDRMQSLLEASLGPPAEWPHEGTLAIDIGRTAVAGVDAKDVAIRMQRDPAGLAIERFAIGDVGGAKLGVSGRVDTREAAPRGTLSLDLDASSLDGVAAVAGKFSLPVADAIRRVASRSVPVHLHTSLALDRDAAGGVGAPTLAKLKLQGSAGVLRLDLQGDASNAVVSSDLTHLGSGKVHLKGMVDSNDGSVLVEMLHLDRLVAINQRSGRLTLDLNGPLDGDVAVKGQLSAGGVDISANGTMHLPGERGPTAEIQLRAAAADIAPLRFAGAQGGVPSPWSTLTARLTLADGAIKVADINGALAGIAIRGELGIGTTEPMQVSGDLVLTSLDLPAAIGTAIGFPRQAAKGNGAWPTDPFEPGLLGNLSGRIALKVGQVALTSKLNARDLRAVLDFSSSAVTLAEMDGALAGGRVTGALGFARGEEGITASGHLSLAEVDAGALLSGTAASLSGKLTAALDLSGTGRSPIALIGSLGGKGSFTLRDGGIARLNPAAFDMVTRAVDRGLPIDTTRIGERMDAALAAGALPMSLAEGSITLGMGQLRLDDLVVHAKDADFSPTGNIDLTQDAIDARLLLSEQNADASVGGHPDVTVNLKGPIDAPKRTLDVSALTNWLALRAVDQKAKRVDALEQAAREHPDEAGEATDGPAAEHSPIPTPPARAARTGSVGSPAAGSTPSASAPSAAGQPRRSAPAPDQPARAADDSRLRHPAPAVDQAPLPPPIDIRPPGSHGPRG